MIQHFLDQIILPEKFSHKGQNGKVLIIGGSDLFHAASQWSFLAASRWVDMVFYSSVKENNEVLRESKRAVQDGVVVARQDLPAYIEESEVILIGPGMRRDVPSRFSKNELLQLEPQDLTFQDWEQDTKAVVSVLLRKYPQKKWILDAGALQVFTPSVIPDEPILTPHRQEFFRLLEMMGEDEIFWRDLLSTLPQVSNDSSKPARVEMFSSLPLASQTKLTTFAQKWNNATIIVKGEVDLVWNHKEIFLVSGGNAGMTKGGTGDALAGMIAGFWAQSPTLPSVIVASALNKQAAHDLYQKRGHMYNTSDLIDQIPFTWKSLTPEIE